MPLYLFKNVATGEVREILQGMNDTHVYDGKDGSEVGLWVRTFTVPRASIDTKADPFSESDFKKVTDKGGVKVGDLFDLSAELSEKRADIAGIDPVKEKFRKDYKAKTGKENLNLMPKTFESPNVKVEYD
jgi:predicted nucleic acid-binding Zn ribbon protein